jgi:ferrous iron transport protein A
MVKKESLNANVVREGHCAEPAICPLSRVRAGSVVCIKELAASRDVISRLREMGFCEEQEIKLLSKHGNLICLVCNARLGISAELADTIMVAPLPRRLKAA